MMANTSIVAGNDVAKVRFGTWCIMAIKWGDDENSIPLPPLKFFSTNMDNG